MALNIRYEGLGEDLLVTQKSALVNGSDEGKVVSSDPNNNDTVIIAAAESNFLGVAKYIDKGDGGCSIAVRGFQKVVYTGGAPARGNKVELVADGSGGVKTPAAPGTGKYFTISNVNTTNTTCWIFLG